MKLDLDSDSLFAPYIFRFQHDSALDTHGYHSNGPTSGLRTFADCAYKQMGLSRAP